MATFNDMAGIANNATFQYRVWYAMATAALAVYSEPFGGASQPTQAQHQVRAGYASKVLNGSFNLQAATWGVLSNPTILSEAQPANAPNFGIADNDIQFQINAMWNALAGA